MPRVTDTYEVDDDVVALVLEPRDDLVLERRLDGDARVAIEVPGPPVRHSGAAGCGAGATAHEFGADEGPFWAYRRTVEVEPLGGGRVRVRQTVDFWLAIPVWAWFFSGPVLSRLRRLPVPGAPARTPWWAPPDRLSARQSAVLGLLACLSLIAGYLGTLLTQTLTYAASEFGASDTAQGVTLGVVRVGVVLSLVVIGLADRRGRRQMLLVAAAGGCLVTATGALAPGLVALGASQTLARGLSTALAVLIGIVAVEEMPGGSRAYAVSVLAMAGALGAGSAVMLASISDQAESAWRILYVVPLLFLFGVRWIGRRLPETRRYLQHEHDDPRAAQPDARSARAHRLRFALLAAAGFLGAVFTAPASSFQNEFLRDERGFSSAQVSLFTIATNTPGGIGIVVGGALADRRGRRLVGAAGLLAGTAATAAMYLVAGAPMWVLSVAGAILGAATVPALGVYGPELFPTSMRGRANAGLTVLAVAGSSVGLIAAGLLSDAIGGLGEAIALLAFAPVLLAALVLAFFPETAHLELEEINPEDAAPPRA